jgi:hypothetical protein
MPPSLGRKLVDGNADLVFVTHDGSDCDHQTGTATHASAVCGTLFRRPAEALSA